MVSAAPCSMDFALPPAFLGHVAQESIYTRWGLAIYRAAQERMTSNTEVMPGQKSGSGKCAAWDRRSPRPISQ